MISGECPERTKHAMIIARSSVFTASVEARLPWLQIVEGVRHEAAQEYGVTGFGKVDDDQPSCKAVPVVVGETNGLASKGLPF